MHYVVSVAVSVAASYTVWAVLSREFVQNVIYWLFVAQMPILAIPSGIVLMLVISAMPLIVGYQVIVRTRPGMEGWAALAYTVLFSGYYLYSSMPYPDTQTWIKVLIWAFIFCAAFFQLFTIANGFQLQRQHKAESANSQ